MLRAIENKKYLFSHSWFLLICTLLILFDFQICAFAGAEQYRSDCDIKNGSNGTENLLYLTPKHQNIDSPNGISNRSPLQLRQASPFPLESTNRRVHYVTAAAPNPQDRHRSSGK